MEQLIKQIEQWAEDRNIINGSKPIDQAMKLFSEFGELADNVGKGRDCRDDIGDVFVVLTIMCKQVGRSIALYKKSESIKITSDKQAVLILGNDLTVFSNLISQDSFGGHSLRDAIDALNGIATDKGASLQECVQIAYNDIKDRKGVMYNGVFIKESDPAYEDALLNLEADKRKGQKRVSVNLEDL